MVDFTNIVVPIITFSVGFVSGHYWTKWSLVLKKDTKAQSIKNVVAIVILIAWAISVLAEIFSPSYSTSPLIHGIMGAIVGSLFHEDLDLFRKK